MPAVQLLADLGATNARFAIASPRGAIRRLRILQAQDFDTPLAAIRRYIGDLPAAERPREAALAVAAPIVGSRVTFVNRQWSFSIDTLRRQLGFARLRVLNDLEAQAYALLNLDSRVCTKIGRGHSAGGAPKLAVGVGTGLGMAALISAGAHPRVIAGEAGHATLASSNSGDDRVLAAIRRRYGRASVERALSGPGLSALYRALSASGRISLEPSDVSQRARAGDDPLAMKTALVFSRLLGGFCGDMALAFGAFGGVYIVGGVVPALGKAFDRRAFRDAFEDKGRYRTYLARIPVVLVTSKDLGLRGLTTYLRLQTSRS